MKKRRLHWISLDTLHLLGPGASSKLQLAKILFSTVLGILLLPVVSKATHIVGGEIGYKCLGDNRYEITLNVYRDCDTGVEPFDDPAYIAVYDGANTLIKTLIINFMEDDTLSAGVFDTCLVAPSNICVHRTTYRGTVQLDPDPVGGFYEIAYTRCCRNGTIANIVDPLYTGAVYDIMLTKEAMRLCNSSPVINEWPPIFICVNTPIEWDHSAADDFDSVNDSIVYRLCTPKIGGTFDDPKPIPPENPPPFDTLIWKSPVYSLENMMGIGDPRIGEPLQIDQKTGLLTGIPTIQGQFVVGICIDEYDQETGRLLSRTRRDFQYNVGVCMDELTFDMDSKDCSEDLESFSITFTTNAPMLESSIGQIERVSGNTYTIQDLMVGDSVVITYSNNSGICVLETTITSPNCSCEANEDVNPPVSIGDIGNCVGDAIAPLTAIVEDGQTVDWYDAPIGGNLLAAGTTTFITTTPGTYYAEARVIANECTSLSRTPFTLIINELPDISLTSEGAMCADDLLTYSVAFTTNVSDIAVSSGMLNSNGENNYIVTGIDTSLDLTITLTDIGTGCSREETIMPPNCSCDMVEVMPPVSGGDQRVCSADGIPALTVTVPDGQTADWYDASINGNLLASGVTSYMPDGPGTFYAAARVLMNECTSPERTAITLVVDETPTFTLDADGPLCADDLLSYSISFISNAPNVAASNGTVNKTGDSTYTVMNIPPGENITITVEDTSGNCTIEEMITAPNCGCENENVAPPVSGGDQTICAGEPIPALTATAGSGETIDWYEMATGGSALALDTNAFTPPVAGIYYAETRVEMNGCTSTVRTPVELIVNITPTFTIADGGAACAEDLLSYSVSFTSDAEDVSSDIGTLTSDGNGMYTITGIDTASSVVITLTNNSTNCSRTETIEAPDCDCVDITVEVPVSSGGDQVICSDEAIPALTVTVQTDATADWYDAEIGGNLLAEGTLAFVPAQAGTYYAEARIPVNNCTSNSRTPVTLTINPIPSYELASEGAVCADNLQTYSVRFTTDASDIEINAGVLTDGGANNYTVDGIPTDSSLTIVLTNSDTNCSRTEQITAPTCACENFSIEPPISGGDQEYCPDEAIPALTATVPNGQTVDWYDSATDGNLLAAGTASFTAPGPGTYFAEARIEMNSCTSTVRTAVVLLLKEAPEFELSGEGPVCAIDLMSYSISFTTNADGVGTSAGQLVNNGDGSYAINDIPNGTDITIQLSNEASGCTARIDISAPNCSCEILGLEPPSTLGDVEVCEGDANIPPLSATTPSGVAVDWYDAPTGGNLLLENSPQFSPAQPGTYYAQARHIESECTVNPRTPVSFIINANPTFVLDSTLTDCNDDGMTYSISFVTTADSVVASSGQLTDNGNGSFTVSNITRGEAVEIALFNTTTMCESAITVDAPDCMCIGINIDPPSAEIDSINTCEGDPVPQFAAIVPEGITVDWYDSLTAGNLIVENAPFFMPDTPGTYYAEARQIDGECTSTTRTAFTWTTMPYPSFSTDPSGPQCEVNQQTYRVLFSTDADMIEVSAGTLEEIGPGDYQVMGIPVNEDLTITMANMNNDCELVEVITTPDCMVICEEPHIFVPSAFSPNSDGSNDIFRVRSEVLESVRLIVYNRWGEEMYVGDDLNMGWDGTFKGKILPPDVYVYYVTAVCFGGETFTKKGNVTLLR